MLARLVSRVRHTSQRQAVACALSTTSEPLVKRGDYKYIDDKDIEYFKSILPHKGAVVYDDEKFLEAYNVCWLGKYKGASKVLLRPKFTKEVSEVLSYCYDNKIALVPQGGNTGLVGGSVPVFDEVILSLQKMNTIHKFDELSGVLQCDAGCILDNIDLFLKKRDHCVPLDLGAKQSCHIGGNVATNAGGLRFMRYGSLHKNVLGLEVVLPNGQILDLMNPLEKDNTGYDLKQLFIGSEGTLGVITKVAICCPRDSKSIQLAYLACETFEQVTNLLKMTKSKLGEILSAFEYLDQESVDVALQTLPHLKNPLGQSDGAPGRRYYVLIETRGSDASHDAEKLEKFLSSSLESGVILDGTISQNAAEASQIWQLRESVTEALRQRGATYKYDVSVPIDSMDAIVQETRSRLAQNLEQSDWMVVGYGHVADSNLHLNISVPHYDNRVADVLEPWIYSRVASCRGSISAEHGIGQMKSHALHLTKNKGVLDMMRSLKDVFDPKGIMNPYKIFAQRDYT